MSLLPCGPRENRRCRLHTFCTRGVSRKRVRLIAALSVICLVYLLVLSTKLEHRYFQQPQTGQPEDNDSSSLSTLVMILPQDDTTMTTTPPATAKFAHFHAHEQAFAARHENASFVVTWDQQHPRRLKRAMADFLFQRNPFCTALQQQQQALTKHETGSRSNHHNSSSSSSSSNNNSSLLQVSVDGAWFFEQAHMGTGNILAWLYALRWAARTRHNTHVLFTCPDTDVSRLRAWVIPWVTGYFPPSSSTTYNTSTQAKACASMARAPLHHMVPDLQFELRRMAVALVGVPSPDHPAAAFVKQYAPDNNNTQHPSGAVLQVQSQGPPLFPNVQLDAIAIHFRCGDLVEHKGHAKYSFVRFSDVAQWIRDHWRNNDQMSIGIVTQPFRGQSRTRDGSDHTHCRILVTALRDYLQEHFADARVAIRNGPDETVALAYARLIMARQTLSMTGASTFSLWPSWASFGTGYLRQPPPGVLDFLANDNDKTANTKKNANNKTNVNADLVLVRHGDVLPSVDLVEFMKLGNTTYVLEWFRGEAK